MPASLPLIEAGDCAELRESNSLLDDTAGLRQRILQDGYLFFRGVVATEAVDALREEITGIMTGEEWLNPSAEPMSVVAGREPTVEGEEAYFSVYDKVQALESFHGLPHRAEIRDLLCKVLGDSAFPHPLGIARLAFPDNRECTTPPHQDYPNNQGTEDLFAAWIPLGDCSRELGGLAILEGSHRLGLLPLAFSLGAGGRQAVLPPEAASLRWLTADFRRGDVLIFGSLCVHCSLPNRSGDNIRLSADFRFQREGEALTPTVLEPHFGRLSWDEIYSGWKDKALCYYWRDKTFDLVEWDATLHDLPPEHMVEAVKEARGYRQRRQQRFRERGE